MTYQEILHWGEEELKKIGIEEYKSDAWLLFSYIFQMSRVDFLMNCIEWQDDVKTQCWEDYQTAIAKRKEHIPVQYITHEQNFYGYDFYVDERVLIPRQDTEVLIECVEQTMQQEMLQQQKTSAGKLLDVCTGSGCIAITLAHVLKWEKVCATDISKDALAVAEKNNEALDHMVELYQGDLFSAFAQEKEQFDVIVSNPPYIESAVIDTLTSEVKDHEPRLALDGEEDGLIFYRRIIAEARQYLKKEGWLFFEIGYNQAEAVRQLFYENQYKDVRIVADLAGLDRVACARMGSSEM